MIIRKMRASFGTLRNSELKLTGGLNIIEAPNEAGKSTWCAFLRTMLYGLNTSERDRNGCLSDKTHYRPWDGGAMEGELEVSVDGRSVTLRRTGTAASPMKTFAAFYTDTGDALPLAGADAGEALTKAPEHVFERTAFIRQAGIRVDKAYELEKRIAALVSSGEEQTSYAEAEEKLRSWKNALGRTRTGLLPKLREQKAAGEEKLRAFSQCAEGLADARAEVERLETVRNGLSEDLKNLEILEKRAEARRVIDAKKALGSAEEKLRAAKAEAEKYAEATDERKDELKAAAAALAALIPVRENAEKTCMEAREKEKKARERVENSPFAGKTADEADDVSDRARALKMSAAEEELNAAKRIASVKTRKLVGAVGWAVIIALCLAAAQFAPSPIPFYVLAAFVTIGAALFLLLYKPKADLSDRQALEKLLSENGFSDTDALVQCAEEYKRLCEEQREAQTERRSAEASFADAQARAEAGQARLSAAIGAAFPRLENAAQVRDALVASDAAQAAYREAEKASTAAKNVYEAVSAAYEGDPETVDDGTLLRQPLRGREDTLSALSRAERQLTEARSALDQRTGEASSFGAPEVMTGELARIDGEIAAAEEKLAALEIADAALSDADAELRTRFSPLISRRAGEILAGLTGGRYERLTFDSSFSAETKTPDDPVGRSAMYASAGTADQIYLALRLAMCELLLPGGECPLVLDDALANFDDERAGYALETIRDIARKRQVLLFTCHSREGERLSGKPDVNVIKL
ncbi:MAG: AAA family ATPase [Oscillospiraceae bacterium]|nr:AAA family ATPase [Oscillospiraceae bacterium]